MASMFGGLFSRVIKVSIQGNITQKTTQKIFLGMNQAKIYKPEAVVVVINSAGGELGQAKSISNFLKQYGQRKNIPIYCFAQDQCLGSANILLTTGVKAYITQMTMLGDFNFSWNKLWYKKFADKYNVRQEFIFSGNNKVKFNPFEDMRPDSEKWMQNYLYHLEHDLKSCVAENRQTHFRKKNFNKDDLQAKVFKNTIIKPSQALQNGLIDGFKTFDELMNTTFSGTKVLEINKTKNKLAALKKLMNIQ